MTETRATSVATCIWKTVIMKVIFQNPRFGLKVALLYASYHKNYCQNICKKNIVIHTTLPYPGTSVTEGARNSDTPVTQNAG